MIDLPDNENDNSAARFIAEWEDSRKKSRKFRDDAKKLVDVYKDEKTSINVLAQPSNEGSYNIFWSNVNVLKPALYSRTPKPVVERRYRDSDPIARVAAQVLERDLEYAIGEYDFNETLFSCRDDWLIVGRGQAWVRYIPTISSEEVEGEVVERLDYEEVVCEYVHWSDFDHSPARTWREVTWVSRRAFMTRKKLIERFGEIGRVVPLAYSSKHEDETADDEDVLGVFKKAIVIELWNKEDKTVYWFCPQMPERLLDKREDPLNLKDFFPCPKPLLATHTTDCLIPIADYKMYQHQAVQLDRLNTQRSILIRSLKASGVYDAQFEGIKRILEEGIENQLIPIEDWPRFLESGGFAGVVQFMPLKDLVALLNQIDASIQITKQQLFEITGMSDLIRGVSAPHETATAQQIKGQFATLRLSDRQRDIQRFARDLIAIKGEIMAEKFEPETLALMAGAYTVQDPQTGEQLQVLVDTDSGTEVLFDQAVELLRTDALRRFRIDIETDSTIAIDEATEKTARLEFLQYATQYINASLGVIQARPEMLGVVGEMLLFVVRTFRTGRDLETSIEKVFGELEAQQRAAAENPQPAPPDPKMLQVQQQAQKDQALLQLKQQELQIKVGEIQQAAAEKQVEMQVKQQEAQMKMTLELERLKGELNVESQRIMAELQMKAEEFRNKENIETAKILAKQTEAQKDKPKQVKFFTDENGKRTAQLLGTNGELQDQYVFVTKPDGSRVAVPVAEAMDLPTEGAE